MAIAPAITPIVQLPLMVSYVKSWRRIAGLWKCKVLEEEEAVPGAS